MRNSYFYMHHVHRNIYQFKITLDGVRPAVWRRIQVPEAYTFWDLHTAIQAAMGWTDTHLHEFRFYRGEDFVYIGVPEHFESREMISERKERIKDWFSLEKPRAVYTYDFGDTWAHVLNLEKILPAEPDTDYPRCIKGKRACPPEDCGGPWGYADLCKIIKDTAHKEHKEMMEWLGGEFDPEDFDPAYVEFEDPEEVWKQRLFE